MKERNKGIFYITLAAFCFAMMSLFVRLSGDLPPMQKAFFRNFVALFVCVRYFMERSYFTEGTARGLDLFILACFLRNSRADL